MRPAPAVDHLVRPLLVGLVLAAIAAAYWGLDLPRHASVDGMRELVDSHAPYGGLVFMALVVAGILTQVPMMGTAMIAVGGVVLGRFPALVFGWVASLVGTTSTFLIVRYVARDSVQRALHDRFRELDDRLTRHGFWTVFVLRLLGGLAPPLNWGLGVTGVSLPHYLAGTGLGLIPSLGFIVFFADAIVSRATGGGGLSLTVILRGVSLLAFGACLTSRSNHREPATSDMSDEGRGSRLPLVTNLASFAAFYPVLILAAGGMEGRSVLVLSMAGCALAVAGAVLFRTSRAALGPAWSLAPRAGEQTGFVTSGPYRLVRHPIYLALSMVAAGQAVAFANGPALLIVLAAVIPSFLWRARVEERLLGRVFGDRYFAYRQRTKRILPYLL